MQRDFTSGSIPRHLISFTMPLLAGNLLQVLYNTVDSVWVGRYVGPAGLGAVSISFPLMFAMLALIFGFTMATTTLVAQYRGAKDEPRVRRTIATSLMLLCAGSLLISALGVLFRYPLLRLIQTPPEMLEMAAGYMGFMMGGLTGFFLFNAMGAILRGLGDSTTPVKFMVIATAVNLILDPLLILGLGPFPRMGVSGAGLATALSQAAAALFLGRWLMKKTDLVPRIRSDWRVDVTLARLLAKVGFPSGLQQMIMALGMVTVISIVNSFGETTVAAFGAASRLDQMAIFPAMSIGLAVTSMVGQNLGAGLHQRVQGVVRWACLMGAGVTGSVALLAIIRPTILMVLFTTDAEVLQIGSSYLQIMGWSYITVALTFILGGVLRGAGDTLPPMLFSLLALWLLRVPLVIWMADRWGSDGIWLGLAISNVGGLALHWGYYLTGRWKRRVAIRPSPPPGKPVPVSAE